MVLEDGIYSSSWWQWIVGDSVGNLVVAWQGVLNQGTPDPRYKFWAQRFDTAGNVVGAKFQINDDDHYWNGGAHVAMNNNGLVTFLWSQAFPTGESYNVVQFMDLQDVGIYIPGDANNDRVVNISDAVCLISYIFAGGYAPANTCLGDADGNGIVNVADAVTLISYIFAGGTISGGCPR